MRCAPAASSRYVCRRCCGHVDSLVYVQGLLESEFVLYKMVPVLGFEDMARANERFVKDNTEVRLGLAIATMSNGNAADP